MTKANQIEYAVEGSLLRFEVHSWLEGFALGQAVSERHLKPGDEVAVEPIEKTRANDMVDQGTIFDGLSMARRLRNERFMRNEAT